MSSLKKGDVVGDYRIEGPGPAGHRHIYLACKRSDTNSKDRVEFVLKLFDSEGTRKQYDRFTALPSEIQNQKSDTLCKIVVHGSDPNKGAYVVMEAVRPNEEWAQSLEEYVKKGKLSLYAAWAVVAQVADAAKRIEAHGGHGQLRPDNILVAEPEGLKIKVVDWLKEPAAGWQPDTVALGKLLHYLLTGKTQIVKDKIDTWEEYKDSCRSQLETIHLSKNQQTRIEYILKRVYGANTRYSNIDEFLDDVRGIPGILPVPPIYSYGLLASLVVFLAGAVFMFYAGTSHFLPGTITPVTLTVRLSQTPTGVDPVVTTPLPSSTPSSSSTPTQSITTPALPTPLPTTPSPVPIPPLPGRLPTPTATRMPTPTPTPTPATKVHLKAIPGRSASIRDSCENGGPGGWIGGTYNDYAAEMHVNDAYKVGECVWVWAPQNYPPQETRGYVPVDEVCIVAEDFDHGQRRFGEQNWTRVLATGLKRCP